MPQLQTPPFILCMLPWNHTSPQVSPPLVAFRESVGHPGEVREGGAAVGSRGPPRVVEAATPNGAAIIRVRAAPLPAALASALDSHAGVLKRALAAAGQAGGRAGGTQQEEGAQSIR